MTTRERIVDGSLVDQHTIARSLALHLLPGIATATLFFALAPVVIGAGYPAIAAGVLAAAVAVVAAELGWLLREAHRRTGRWSLTSVLPYRPGPFTWRKALLVLGLLAWGLLGAPMLVGDLKPLLIETVFARVPGWAINPLPADIADTATGTAMVLTAVGYALILVVLGPLVEELYFRGYLLPRLARFAGWAPLLNVSLFAVYHLWKPWDVVTVATVLLPTVYAVWWTRDIRIGIAVHVGLNGLGFLLNVAPTLLAG
ncbi:CPBP family intramembrane glutamic endopeptidase [Pseudonocardia broussonetiae]|uniref:CPBP family intramembrane metalloprotease n=1 Tax=Pseudonocardia broussonetiae TaxID=2736640 RepID=A0A6M6JP16_9PSEU|nr:CPBP family intramembrane glutamic endopeptidase [Pseudonocardia broussonetiae]QJY49036.1 CPBP family intramembrane metalloprotease [Pseudonocardia broussonetiae]